MRRQVGLSLSAVAVLAACAEQPSAPSAPHNRMTPSFSLAAPGTSMETGRYIVAFKGAIPASFGAQVQSLGGQVLWSSSGARLAALNGLTSADATSLAGQAGVVEVDADQAFALDMPALAAADASGDVGTTSNANPAGAFFFPRQWNMRAVHADQAWSAGFRGSSSVSIYLLDSGIDYLHFDLRGRVDLTRSIDLLGTFTVGGIPFTEADTVHKYFPTRAAFTDLFFHGTHVGSTISSNSFVAAGVTTGTTIVAVKVCAYLNTCPLSSILNGVIYAADNGGDVINMSLGGAFAKPGNGALVGLLNQVFNYARDKGVTIVVSAGNAHADLDHNGSIYSTFCNNSAVICVAATGPTAQVSTNGPWTDVDAPATYSNFGRSAINVAAPGGNHSSFVWAACSQTSLFDGLTACAAFPTFIVGAQGTSMAAPHVAGTAALLVPILGRNPGAIKARIQKTSDDLGAPGTDPFYGKGRVNVARAVGAIP